MGEARRLSLLSRGATEPEARSCRFLSNGILAAFEGCKQGREAHVFSLGSIPAAKETNELLINTFAPIIDGGIQELNDVHCFTANWTVAGEDHGVAAAVHHFAYKLVVPKADCGESAEIDVHMTALPSTFQPDLVDGRLTLKHESGDAAKDVVFAREGLPETLEARPSIMKSSLSDATRVGTIYTCSCVRGAWVSHPTIVHHGQLCSSDIASFTILLTFYRFSS